MYLDLLEKMLTLYLEYFTFEVSIYNSYAFIKLSLIICCCWFLFIYTQANDHLNVMKATAVRHLPETKN